MANRSSPYDCEWMFSSNVKPKADLRIFLFHHAGGSPALFSDWYGAFPANVEVLGISLPGRGLRKKEKPQTDVREVVSSLLNSALPLFEEKPFIVFGHCYGALGAYHLTRELQRLGKRLPLRLILAGRAAPSHVFEKPNHKRGYNGMVEVIKGYGQTPKEILNSPTVLSPIVSLTQSDWTGNETYTALYTDEGAVVDVPFTLCRGMKDFAEIRDDGWFDRWDVFSSQECSMIEFDGNHFFHLAAKGRKVLIEHLKNFAAQALEPHEKPAPIRKTLKVPVKCVEEDIPNSAEDDTEAVEKQEEIPIPTPAIQPPPAAPPVVPTPVPAKPAPKGVCLWCF